MSKLQSLGQRGESLREEMRAIELWDRDFLSGPPQGAEICMAHLNRQIHRIEIHKKIRELIAQN